MKKAKKIIIAVITVIIIIVGVCSCYLADYYRADTAALSEFKTDGTVTVSTVDGMAAATVYSPLKADSALIFYPGGKVEHTAYEPLMKECASRGIMCILIEMPFNLAVFDVNAADGLREKYPEIEDWYIGGHSLGGSMAASYLSNDPKGFEGLILLGSYSTEDLTLTDIDALSVYGSEDQVLDKEKYELNKLNLPVGYKEYVIDGGCHAYFGMYGAQDGDGTPTISNEEQITKTAEIISSFIND